MKKLLSALALAMAPLLGLCADLPDAHRTPGAVDPAVTQENIRSTICVKGYTKTVRPPSYYTNKLKKSQIREYGYDNTNPKEYEEDHLVALGIGGSPSDEHNLWPQPRNSEWGADKKDALEFVMQVMVCRGELGLKQAQFEMSSNWIAAYKKYVASHPNYKYHGGGD